MDLDLKNLPDDANLTKDTVVSLVNQVEEKYQEKIHYLEEQLRLFKKELFGRSSEKRYEPPPDQMPLFEEDDIPSVDRDQTSEETVVIATHARKKGGRKPLPEDLPRIDIIHDISEEKKLCGCGQSKSCIGQEVSEKLDFIPPRVQVERHIL